MEKKKEIKISLWVRFWNRVDIKKVKKATSLLKILSCFMVAILGITLLSLTANAWGILSKEGALYIHINKQGDTMLNPDFKWIVSSLALLTFGTIVSGITIFRIFTTKSLSGYKNMVWSFLIIIIGFFIGFWPLAKGLGIYLGSEHKRDVPSGIWGSYFNTPWNMLISLSAIGIPYLTMIGTIIFLEKNTSSYK